MFPKPNPDPDPDPSPGSDPDTDLDPRTAPLAQTWQGNKGSKNWLVTHVVGYDHLKQMLVRKATDPSQCKGGGGAAAAKIARENAARLNIGTPMGTPLYDRASSVMDPPLLLPRNRRGPGKPKRFLDGSV
jgi:hypothetical protein